MKVLTYHLKRTYIAISFYCLTFSTAQTVEQVINGQEINKQVLRLWKESVVSVLAHFSPENILKLAAST